MARIRTIKPEYFTHPRILRLPIAARLLFAALWTQADDHGRLRYQPHIIGALTFAPEDRQNIPELFRRLSEEGRIVLYEVDGEQFCAIHNWTVHQKISHPTPSRYPAPPQDVSTAPEILRNPPESFRPEQGTGNREQGSRNREQGTGKNPLRGEPRGAAVDLAFETEFWTRYPKARRHDKAKCRTLWRALAPSDRTAAVAGLIRWLASDQWTDPARIVWPERFLRRQDWTADPPPAKRTRSDALPPLPPSTDPYSYIDADGNRHNVIDGRDYNVGPEASFDAPASRFTVRSLLGDPSDALV